MTLLDHLAEPIWQRLGLALLHFLWQGAVIAALAVLAIRLMRLRRGSLRYIAYLAAMIVMAAAPAVTFCLVDETDWRTIADASAARLDLPADASAVAGDGPGISAVPPIVQPNESIRLDGDGRSALQAAEGNADGPAVPVMLQRLREGLMAALPYAIGVWLIGVSVFGIRLLSGLVGLLRLRRGAEPLPALLAGRIPPLAERFGLPGFRRVFASPALRRPVAVGLIRPMVLVPMSMLTALPTVAVEAIIAHELAHIRRHDGWIIVLQRLIEAVLFFHPLVWWMSRCLSAERELCCDELAVRATGQRLTYAEALEAAARFDLQQRGLALAPGLGARRGALLERVRHLLGIASPSNRSAWPAGLVVLIALALGAQLTLSTRPAGADDGSRALPDGALVLRIVDDETGEPIPGAQLGIREWAKERVEVESDADGEYVYQPPDELLDSISISVKANGYTPLSKWWGRKGLSLELPDVFTFRMPRGTSIGGVVRNAEGDPIEGATIRVSIYRVSTYPLARFDGHECVTDADGRWRCDIVPPGADRLEIGQSHPDYGSYTTNSFSTYTDATSPSIAQFRDMTAEFVLKRGATVRGRIIDPLGGPVDGLTIGLARPGSDFISPMTMADAEGEFQFTIEPGQITIGVQVPGRAPALKIIQAAPGMEPIEIQLKPGRTIRGRIVNADGEPVAGAWVAGAINESPELPWSGYTDAAGWFTCDCAPDAPMKLTVQKPGYMVAREVPVTPGETEHIITLQRELIVRGHIVDASTGESVDRFDLIVGPSLQTDREPYFQEREREEETGGEFVRALDESHYSAYAFRVEAFGYLPAVSRLVKPGEGEAVLEFALQRGEGPAGRVIRAGGAPVAGAEVILADHSSSRVFAPDPPGLPDDRIVVKTDEQGCFRHRPQTGPYAIAALHKDGCATATQEEIEAGDPLVIDPWARVEGVFMIRDEPAVNRVVSLDMHDTWYLRERDAPSFSFGRSTTTNEDGRFVFDRVPAGLGRVSHYVSQPGMLGYVLQGARFDVQPGETTHVQLGGRGRPVIGRLTLPDSVDPDLSMNLVRARLKLDVNPYPWPENWREMEGHAQLRWYEEWNQSPEGQQYYRRRFREMRSYALEIGEDGAFRAEDVLPGPYLLEVELVDPNAPQQCGGRVIGKLEQKFELDGPAERLSDEPFDLGTHEIDVSTRLHAGQAAPAFECKTLDGEPLRLADCAGKYVLLDFWATWCGPCVVQTPHLKALHEAFGDDERFVMIGLSLDKDIDRPRAYVEKHDLQWVQGFLGDWSKTDVPASYGVHGIPQIMLISPEGRVIAKDLRGAAIRTAVQAALGR